MAERYHWDEQYILGDVPGGLSFAKAMQYRARALRAAGYWTVIPSPPIEDQWSAKLALLRALRP